MNTTTLRRNEFVTQPSAHCASQNQFGAGAGLRLVARLLAAGWVVATIGALADEPRPEPIDRHALVTRHNVTLTKAVPGSVLQVGNGEFAFGVDLTGLQTTMGNTLSHWSWHTFPLPPGQRPEDLRLEEFDTYGRKVGYATSSKGQETLYNWLRENPHRFNLGRLRLLLDGEPPALAALGAGRQQLDLWSGLIVSRYTLAGQPVRVETCCHPARDLVAVRIESPLVSAGRLAVELAFPYGDPGATGGNWQKPQAHTTTMRMTKAHQAEFTRQLDADHYAAGIQWSDHAKLRETQPHTFDLTPERENEVLELIAEFSKERNTRRLPAFQEVKSASAKHWPKFWKSGGAIDLSASKDPRWRELERRIVLSQYLLAVNEAGSLPPQENGLFNNNGSWNGKFHLEMHWWHGTHYALWDRWPLFECSLGWYRQTLPGARELAKSQGYRGARWPKLVGPNGNDAPSGIGPLIIWQQPNLIYYAELDYRLHPGRATLAKWRDLVFETADFMAAFAVLDEATGQYFLGPPMKTVPENTDPRVTRNPAFELSYWRFGLRMAQEWRARLGLAPEPAWAKVFNRLAPLPMADGVYLQQEGMTNTYTKMNWEHPSLIGPLGMLPGDGVDPKVMKTTVAKVMATWQWNHVWGWDFPMMAMAAARNGEPAMAITALLHPSKANDLNEVGLSSGGPFPYFPSNGGLLFAAAMMAAGWDGGPQRHAPGFPDDGLWVVKWEGLKRSP
jgi:hypothetical protein